MSITIRFSGRFELDRPLTAEQQAYLRAFSDRGGWLWDESKISQVPDPLREAVNLPVGPLGIYFTGHITENLSFYQLTRSSPKPELRCDGTSLFKDVNVISHGAKRCHILPTGVEVPYGQCQWTVSPDGKGIEDCGEKFYTPALWMEFLLRHFLYPWGYTLSGEVAYSIQEHEVKGRVVIDGPEVNCVVDQHGILTRIKEDLGLLPVMRTYWLVVGYTSPKAREQLLKAECVVKDIAEGPGFVLVGLHYNVNAYRTDGEDDLRIYGSGDLILGMRNFRLYWEMNHPLYFDYECPGNYHHPDIVISALFEDPSEAEKWYNRLYPHQEILRYWSAVGKITPRAKTKCLAAGCVIYQIHHDPSIFLIGIPYDPMPDAFDVEEVDLEINGKENSIFVKSLNLHLLLHGSGQIWIEKDDVAQVTLMAYDEVEHMV